MNTLLACLAPIEVLHRNIQIAYLMAAVSATVVSVSFFLEWRRKKFPWLLVYVPLFLWHPAWQLAWAEIRDDERVSADCFFGVSGESIFLTAMLIAVLFVVIQGGVSRRLFLLRTVIAFWIFFALQYFFISAIDEMLLSFVSRDLAGHIDGTLTAGGARAAGDAMVLTIVCAVSYLIQALRKQKPKEPIPASAKIEER